MEFEDEPEADVAEPSAPSCQPVRFGSSRFDPNAPVFLPRSSGGSGGGNGSPGAACGDLLLETSADASLGSTSVGSSTSSRESGTSPQAFHRPQGPSLVFGGGGDFLAKYREVQREGAQASEASALRNRKAGGHDSGGAFDGLAKDSPSAAKAKPAPDRVNLQINSLLVHAKNADKLLQVVETHISNFNPVNMITALHRLATLVLPARKGALRRDVRFKSLIFRLSETLRNADNGALKPQDLSNVAWALTKLGLMNSVLFGSLSEHILRTIQDFEPVNLSMTLWAFARSGFLDAKLCRASAVEVKRRLPDFQPQQISNTTWAMAKSGFVDEELFVAAADLALEKLGQFQPMNYSMLLYSFALAKLPHPKLFEEVGKRCTVVALTSAASAPHVVTNLAFAFSEAGIGNERVFDTIAKVACNTLDDFRTQQITTIAQAFARAQVKNTKLISCINRTVVSRLAEFKQQDLQDLLASYDSLGVSTVDIARAIESEHCQVEEPSSNLWMILSLLIFTLLVTVLAVRIKVGS